MTAASGAPAVQRDMAGEGDVARLALGAAVLLTMAFFWPTVWSFTQTWGRYDYAHGWLVPGLVAWLLWNDRGAFRHVRGGDPLLLIPLVGLSLFWAAATITHIQLFHQTAFVLLMMCWGLFVFGRRGARPVIVSTAVVLLSLPLWEALLPILRRITTVMSGGMVTLLRVPADIDGDLIHLPSGSFEIADGCAGLNYLLSALVIGIVYAQVLVRGTRARLLVVGAAAAIAIVGNWIRVALIVVVGHVTEMQAWLIPNHVEFGWGVFAASLLVFFALASKIERRATRAAPEAERDPPSTEVEPATDERQGNGDGVGRIRRMSVASALAIVGPALYFTLAALPPAGDQSAGLDALAGGAGWRMAGAGAERPFDWSPAYLGAQQHDQVRFTDGTDYVYGDRLVYWNQAQSAKLIGWPNRIARSRDVLDEQVVGPVDPAARLRVRQAVVRTPEGPILTWYWYRVGGQDTFMPVHAKVLEIPAFLSRRRASELIALSAACEPQDCRNAFEALAGFMGARRAPAGADEPDRHEPDRP